MATIAIQAGTGRAFRHRYMVVCPRGMANWLIVYMVPPEQTTSAQAIIDSYKGSGENRNTRNELMICYAEKLKRGTAPAGAAYARWITRREAETLTDILGHMLWDKYAYEGHNWIHDFDSDTDAETDRRCFTGA